MLTDLGRHWPCCWRKYHISSHTECRYNAHGCVLSPQRLADEKNCNVQYSHGFSAESAYPYVSLRIQPVDTHRICTSYCHVSTFVLSFSIWKRLPGRACIAAAARPTARGPEHKENPQQRFVSRNTWSGRHTFESGTRHPPLFSCPRFPFFSETILSPCPGSLWWSKRAPVHFKERANPNRLRSASSGTYDSPLSSAAGKRSSSSCNLAAAPP